MIPIKLVPFTITPLSHTRFVGVLLVGVGTTIPTTSTDWHSLNYAARPLHYILLHII